MQLRILDIIELESNSGTFYYLLVVGTMWYVAQDFDRVSANALRSALHAR